MAKRKSVSFDLRVQELFSLDLRSLALFRITFGLLILSDLVVRATFLQAHYTDFGVLPRIPLIEQFNSPWRVSLHYMSGLWQIQALLFALQAVLAVMFLIGYRTRLATFFSWVMMVSLHYRNPMVLQAGDFLFRMLLFWGMFLPLNARGSVDSVLEPPQSRLPERVFSMATVALFAQIGFVYWFTSAFKLSPESFPIWWEKATAVHNALSIDQFTRPFGYFLLQFPHLLKFLSRAVICFEILGPLLLISPFFTEVVRTIGVLSFWFLHLGFGLCMSLGPFPWISSIAMIPFLPTLVWENLEKVFKKWNFNFRLESLQKGIAPKVSLLPKPAGSIRLSLSKPGILLVSLSLIYVFFWNLGTLQPRWDIPRRLRWIGILTGLEQRWNMFSPPLTEDGWYVIPGILRNGDIVDLFKEGGPLTWQKPIPVSRTYANERWRKYMMNLWIKTNAPHRLYYGKYLCRNWNAHHQGDLELQKFQIYYVREKTLPDGRREEPRKILLWKHWCFKTPEEVTKLSANIESKMETLPSKSNAGEKTKKARFFLRG